MAKCPSCGTEFPDYVAFCGMCGSDMSGKGTQPRQAKSEWRLGIVALTIGIAMMVVLVGFYYLMFLRPTPYQVPTVFGIVRTSTFLSYIWTVTAISGPSALRSEVFVMLRNASMEYVITSERLDLASGTHGFWYEQASPSNFINVGDDFALSKDYAAGTQVSLVNAAGSSQYCVMTV